MKKLLAGFLVLAVFAVFSEFNNATAKTSTQIKNEKKGADAKAKSKAKSDAKKKKNKK